MGLLLSKMMSLFQEWSQGSPSRVLMLGLDAAGKILIHYIFIFIGMSAIFLAFYKNGGKK